MIGIGKGRNQQIPKLIFNPVEAGACSAWFRGKSQVLLHSVIQGPASWASPGSWGEMQNLRSHPRPTESVSEFSKEPQVIHRKLFKLHFPHIQNGDNKTYLAHLFRLKQNNLCTEIWLKTFCSLLLHPFRCLACVNFTSFWLRTRE